MELIERVLDLAALPGAALPDDARQMARFSLLDWMACGIAGAAEPVAVALRALAAAEGGAPVASLIGGAAAPARMAAMVNGAASHALDYDDTHFAHVGHLSVGLYPAALAVGEDTGASAADVTDAFLAGAEAAIWVGLALGRAHYNLGFHQTATAGAFGATVAAGRLKGLDCAAMRAALGLCSTRASGLKSQFGTMGKPLNAGIAAANGVECATLAALGVSSADDGLAGPQGFLATHTTERSVGAVPGADTFLFTANKYKLHACCHGTHAMIEALLQARGQGVEAGAVAGLHLRTNPRWLKVCDIKRPRTGLEVKFSYGWLAGMVLRGDATADDRAYTDALAGDAALAGFAERVEVTGDDALTDLQAEVTLTLTDGRDLTLRHDLDAALPAEDLAQRLRAKAHAIAGARGDALWDLPGDLAGLTARDLGAMLRQPAG